ncbi:MAG: hypothetical protein ACOCXZ_01030 [Chloroflexota bacterium]
MTNALVSYWIFPLYTNRLGLSTDHLVVVKHRIAAGLTAIYHEIYFDDRALLKDTLHPRVERDFHFDVEGRAGRLALFYSSTWHNVRVFVGETEIEDRLDVSDRAARQLLERYGITYG